MLLKKGYMRLMHAINKIVAFASPSFFSGFSLLSSFTCCDWSPVHEKQRMHAVILTHIVTDISVIRFYDFRFKSMEGILPIGTEYHL